MVAYALIAGGTLAAIAAAVLAWGVRRPPAPEAPTGGDDPWAVFRPRTDEDLDADRPRLAAPLAGVAALALILSGLVLLRSPDDVEER
ncbi:MAG TPA: hypothetical protein VM840_05815, partial [Actinomycetota bacterium]|nr:hypothetical protein [Actinomycetota bacterium]